MRRRLGQREMQNRSILLHWNISFCITRHYLRVFQHDVQMSQWWQKNNVSNLLRLWYVLHTQCICNIYNTSYLRLGTFKNQPLLRGKMLIYQGVGKKRNTFFFSWIHFFFVNAHLKLLKDPRIVPREVMVHRKNKEEWVRLCDTFVST